MERKNKKELGFTIGIFDQITDNIFKKIIQESCSCETYGVGIYTDEFIIENFMTYPSKSFKERVALVKSINEVNFTFLVDTTDSSIVKEIIKEAYNKYLKNN